MQTKFKISKISVLDNGYLDYFCVIIKSSVDMPVSICDAALKKHVLQEQGWPVYPTELIQ